MVAMRRHATWFVGFLLVLLVIERIVEIVPANDQV